MGALQRVEGTFFWRVDFGASTPRYDPSVVSKRKGMCQ